jgi:acyl-coenzyme A thioesterase PaaI-like protein
VADPAADHPESGQDLHADEQASFLTTLGFEYRVDDGVGIGRTTVSGYMTQAPAWPSAAVLLTYADVLIGLLASHRTAPRISITSSLSAHLTEAVPEGTELELVGSLTKLGRSVTVGETTIRVAETGAAVGMAIGTFQASPRPQDVAPYSFDRFRGPQRVQSSAATLSEHVGLRVLRPGLAEIGLRPDLTNATESLQGGLVALLGEAAAQTAATAAGGGTPAVVESLEVHYVAAARVGPFQAEATPLSSRSPNLLRVELRDRGRDDRIVAAMAARTRPAPALGPQP